jgi:dihydrodipicolinate synthase/N-acetylneuraminate lyase
VNCKRPEGIITPLLTPFREDEEVDLPGLRRLIDRVVGAGIHAVFALGSSGEFPSLTDAERQLIMEQTVEFVGARVPVWVGVTQCSTKLCIAEARKARTAGADGIVILAPYYFSLREDEIEAHIREVLDAAELPLLLYQNPNVGNGTMLSAELVERLIGIEGVVGIKDSAGNLDEFKQTIARTRGDGFSVLQGDENLLVESLGAGARGGVAGLSNVFPHLFVQLYRNCRGKPTTETTGHWSDAARTAYSAYFVGPSLIASLKAVAAVQGVCSSRARRPFLPLNAAQEAKLKIILRQLARFESPEIAEAAVP